MQRSASKPKRVLLVDDDQALCRLIKKGLGSKGFKVHTVHDGREGLVAAEQEEWDAIILDVMLPGLSGFDLLRKIRRRSHVPILMLTVRGEEQDRVTGLEMGADDYLPKPFSIRELLARLKAILRRARREKISSDTTRIISVGPIRINLDAREVTVEGRVVQLTPVEFDLLVTLAKTKGRVWSREELIEEIRRRDYDGYDRSIDVHISSLRKKLGDNPRAPRWIQTVRSIGYMMIDPEKSPPSQK